MSKKGGGGQTGGILNNDLINLESTSGKGNFFENYYSDVANIALNYFTYGAVGYEDGKIGAGVSTKLVKEATGAKAAEEANTMAKKNFEQAKVDAEASRLEQINQTGKDQMRQSMLAGSARAGASSRANRGTAIAGSNLGDERDFLGL